MSDKVSKEAKDDGSWEYPADVMRPDGSTSKVFTSGAFRVSKDRDGFAYCMWCKAAGLKYRTSYKVLRCRFCRSVVSEHVQSQIPLRIINSQAAVG